MPDLIGLGVAAAGNIAGGEAAQALMGNTKYPSGGGIPGLTSTNTGKSGISPTVQVEPGPALQFFQNAANAYTTNAGTGLSYYNQALALAEAQLSGASNSLTAGYNQANQTLQPLSAAGTAATNQYLKMLGLNTQSPTASIASQVGSLGSNYSDLSNKIAAAENIKDPTARAQAMQDIQTAWNSANAAQQQTNQQAIQSANDATQKQIAGIAQPMDWSTALTQSQNAFNAARGGTKNGTLQAQLNNQYNLTDPNISSTLSPALKQQYDSYIAQGNYAAANATVMMGKSQSDYQQKVNAIQSAPTSTNNTLDQSNSLLNQYIQNYSNNPDYFGYTGDQANAQLANTPGYQFSLQQGQEAINRSAAAAGMFNSGNTLMSLDSYSQGLAQQTYNQYMSNLLGIANTGNQATGQISQNQANTGIGQANIAGQQAGYTLNGGQAALNTYGQIGQAQYNALTNQGNTYTQIQLANMAAQNAAIQGANQQGTALAGQQANYALGMNALGYQNAQSQQYAQGYNSGGQAAGNYYTMGGLSFPNYTV